jgi:A/G-specific adenine glycosylase
MLTGYPLQKFRKNILTWFAQNQRDLPWRRTKDPYRIWLSEIMLQQTRVAAAIPYYQRFLERFPDVAALATAPADEVLRFWAGLGYYSRARNLQKAAQRIVAEHNGRFPSSGEMALALPGIGSYTAAAILSIAYGEKHAVLDGNVARVIARLRAIGGDLRTPKRWKELQKAADSLLARDTPGEWNQAMMELGATLCLPRSPQCLLCPVQEFCEARKQGLTDCIPEKRKKRDTVAVTLAALVVLDRKGRTFLLSPPKSSVKKSAGESENDDVAPLLSRMWHFPTIQVKSESSGAAELRRHVGSDFFRGQKVPTAAMPLKKVKHRVTYRDITVLPFLLRVKRLPRIRGAKVLPLLDLSGLAISNLTRKVARAALEAAQSTAAGKQKIVQDSLIAT